MADEDIALIYGWWAHQLELDVGITIFASLHQQMVFELDLA
jgi:hypothetical protein